jgi:hypothetical protein
MDPTRNGKRKRAARPAKPPRGHGPINATQASRIVRDARRKLDPIKALGKIYELIRITSKFGDNRVTVRISSGDIVLDEMMVEQLKTDGFDAEPQTSHPGFVTIKWGKAAQPKPPEPGRFLAVPERTADRQSAYQWMNTVRVRADDERREP